MCGRKALFVYLRVVVFVVVVVVASATRENPFALRSAEEKELALRFLNMLGGGGGRGFAEPPTEKEDLVSAANRDYMLQLYRDHMDYQNGLASQSPLRHDDAEIWSVSAQRWARRNGEEGAYHLSFDVKTEGRIITDAWLRVHTTTGGGRDGCNVEVNPTRERLDLRTNKMSPRTRGRENWIEFGAVGVGDFSTEMLHLNLTIRNCTIEEEPPFLLVSSTVTGEPLSPPSLPKKRRLRRRRSASNRNATCTLRPMTINFDRLGWREWILAPGSYSAGVCQGSCPIRGPYDNFHAHATVVALMRIKGAEVMFGSPVCVAVGRYDSLAVLVAEKGKVSKLKTFKQMVVQHCGCR